MKFAMKHKGLCSMSFVLRVCSCVVFLCTWVAFLCACESDAGNDTQKMDFVTSAIGETDAVVKDAGISDSHIKATEMRENEQVTRKGYNPEMAFNYDEHEAVEINEDYVAGLCAEAMRELEGMFGPAEFYVKAQHSEDDSYVIDVEYNKQAASFTEDELQQITMYINYEYKEINISEINIQGW